MSSTKMEIQMPLLLLVCLIGAATSVEMNRYCYPDHPILDGLLCYKTCKEGYAHWGGGPLCWGKCTANTKDIGMVCIKDTYGRGVGKPLSTCGSDAEKSGLLCYPSCRSGYTGVGPVCWAHCESGYSDVGALCTRYAHIYGRNVDSCPWHDKCGLCGGPWYNVCGKRRDCGKSCDPGYKDDGCTCRRDVHIYAKDTYGRTAGTPMVCKSNEQQNGALCYPYCKSGYYGVGPVCWASCSGQTIDTGTQCQKKAYGRGVGKVVNCLKPPKPSDIKNFTGLVDIFKDTNGFSGLEAAGCSLLYTQMKYYITIIKNFNSCFAKGNWQTISISYVAGVAAGATMSGEIGIAVDTNSKKGICFVGYCVGLKLDVSLGASVDIGWWRSLDDILGESTAYELGVDIPITEVGFGASFINNDEGTYIGTQFSLGLGIGLVPLDVGLTNCNSPTDEVLSITF